MSMPSGYDSWKLDNGDDEAEERDRRDQEREDAEIIAEMRAELDLEWEERGCDG